MTSWVNFINGFMNIWVLSCSTFSIMLIAFDRYINITKPQNYLAILSKKRVTSIMTLFWLLDLPLCVAAEIDITVYYIATPIYLIGTTMLICVFYYYIWKTAHDSQRRVESFSSREMKSQRRQSNLAKKALTLILVYLVIVMLSMAYSVFTFLTMRKIILVPIESEIYTFWVTMFFVTSNSCLNPLIYIWQDREFKVACKRLFTQMRCKRTTQDHTLNQKRSNNLNVKNEVQV
ncbi:histamine H2 receptor-like [Clytia hemisphaerica]|uniref:histamine H2 receptor-like n=1 Tax=Clytia hemisphaerica TaxID=252671 RepID=UPI0034D518DD